MRSQAKPPPDPQPMAQLGAALRVRRKALGLDQASVAAMAGVGLAFMYALEHGKDTARIDKVLAVLRVLGLQLVLQEGKQVLSVATTLAEDGA